MRAPWQVGRRGGLVSASLRHREGGPPAWRSAGADQRTEPPGLLRGDGQALRSCSSRPRSTSRGPGTGSARNICCAQNICCTRSRCSARSTGSAPKTGYARKTVSGCKAGGVRNAGHARKADYAGKGGCARKGSCARKTGGARRTRCPSRTHIIPSRDGTPQQSFHMACDRRCDPDRGGRLVVRHSRFGGTHRDADSPAR